MIRLLLVWIVGISLFVETLAKSKCRRRPCSNTKNGYGINHGHYGDAHQDTPATPEQKKMALILFSVGASISLIGIIIFSVWSKCCGLCKKKAPHTIKPLE